MLTCVRLKEGPGIPLLFLHGFLGTSRDWEPVCAHLPSRHCIGVDLPGHGNSPFTEHFFDAMPPLEKFHLIGYSMGGRLAMQYADRFPEKVASLTIASAHCGLTTDEEKQQRLARDAEWAEKLLSQGDFFKEWYAQSIFGGFVPDLTLRQTHNRKQLAQALLHYSLGRQPLLHPKKALILVGERDEKYRTLFPNAAIIPGAAHMVHLEKPHLFAQHVIQHTNKLY